MSNLAASSAKHPDTAENGLADLEARPHGHQSTYANMPKLAFLDTDFNRKYPPDTYGEEAAENARVWKVYRDERTASDQLMLDGWNQTLDVLLIFAGLFSAVSTAFIVEGYKNLQPDYAEYVADFLYAAAVRTAADNASTLVLPSLDTINPPNLVVPSSLARWVNGLWFSSLVISLAVALLCTLAKQWLYQYNAHLIRPAKSLRDWTRRHALYYDGLVSWGVPTFITGLPLLLHLSLFVFFAGLALFVWPLDGTIAYALIAMSGSLLGFYVIAMFLPLLHIECPSYTPVLVQLMRARVYLTLLTNDALSNLVRKGWLGRARSVFSRTCLRWLWRATPYSSEAALEQVSHSPRRERAVIAARAGTLDARALRLLLQTSSDPDVITVGVEAIGAYPPRSTTVARLGADGGAVRRIISEYFAAFNTGAHSALSYWRSLRSWLCLESVTAHRFFPTYSSTHFVAHILRASSEDLEGRLLECVVPLMDNWYLEPVSEVYVRVRELLDALTDLNLNVTTLWNSGTHDGRPEHLHPATCAMAIQLLPRSECARKLPWYDLLPLMLHLFHVGRLFSLDDANLSYVVDSLTVALDLASTTDRPFLDARAHALHGCLELICYLLNYQALFGLDSRTCEVIAQDVPLVCQTLCGALGRIPAWDGLPHFVAFVSSRQFSDTSWTWEALREIVRFSTIISAARHAWSRSPALCRSMADSFAVLIKTVAAANEEVHPTRTNLLEDLVRQLEIGTMLTSVPPLRVDLLRAFLTGPAAIPTWPATANVRPRKVGEDPLLRLAVLLSAMLHVERSIGSELVPVLFVDEFLHARLSGGLHRLHALALLVDDPSNDLPDLQDDMSTLSRHCAQLSPDGWSHICGNVDGQLGTDEDGPELRLLLHGLRRIDPTPVCPDNCLCSRLRQPPVERRKWTGRLHTA